MSPVIHMETERVRAGARQLCQTAEQLQQDCSQLLTRVRGIDWQGSSREDFVRQCEQIVRNMISTAEEGLALGQRVQHEVDQWQETDSTGSQNFCSVIVGTEMLGAFFLAAFQDKLWSEQYKDFENWWVKLDQEKRLDFLRLQYQKIVRSYGLEPKPLNLEDLPDAKGQDSRGVFRGADLVIDIDNLRDDKPWRLIETMAHESRHQLQYEAVQLYQNDKKVLEGCTEQQVKEWAKNLNDYIKPENDFEEYWGQPIERDARGFGSSIMEDVLEKKAWQFTPNPDVPIDRAYA